MHFNIDFNAQISERLTEAAQSQGIPPSKLLENLVEEFLPSVVSLPKSNLRDHFYFTASTEQFHDALYEIAKMNADLPVLSDEAFDRGALYEDRL